MKNFRFLTLAFLGGLIGFGIHYNITHIPTGISLFSIGPHAIEGTVYTVIGTLIGICFSSCFPKK